MNTRGQRRISIILIAFALQIPAMILMWTLGFEPGDAAIVTLLPAGAILWAMLNRRKEEARR